MFGYRIHPLILALIFVTMMYCARLFLPSFSLPLEIPNSARLTLFLCLLVASFSVVALGALTFRLHKTTVNPLSPEKASTLVTTGIFQITRNPMYLGFTVALLGWGLFLWHLIAMILVIFFWMYLNFVQIPLEEKALNRLFGEVFTQYCKNVRRWL